MSDRAILLARLRFLEQSYKRLQEMKQISEQRYRLELERLLAELRTASTLRGEQVSPDESGRLPDEINSLLEQMVSHPEKGGRARELQSEINNLHARMLAVAQEIEQILQHL